MNNLKHVTGGYGGEAFLYIGKEKTVLHDCGMACFHEELIKNIELELLEKPLDYILLSHTHYDHMGALPYVIKRWPEAKVCASQKADSVFKREGAVNMIVSMGKSAAELYEKNPEKVHAKGLRVDIIMKDCDEISLGKDEVLVAYETKGHTDCSMSYFIKPAGLLFASESTGVLENESKMHTSVLKSFDESFEAAHRLKKLPIEYLVIPHYGLVGEETKEKYFDWYIEEATAERNLIENCIGQGMSPEEIFEEHKKVYWNEVRAKNHPYRAYKMNTEIIIKMLMNK